jgi:hypothetical protein
MRRLIHILLGVDPAPWAEGGSWRLEWLAWPRGDWALAALLFIIAATWGVLWLYRREGRNLALPVRVMLATLRMVAMLGIVVMLLEPVIVFTRKEWVPSNLLVLLDRSDSKDLRDAWVEQPLAERTAAALRLDGGADELRRQSRASLAERALAGGLSEKLAAGGARNVKVLPFAAQVMDVDQAATTGPATTGPATPASQPAGDRGASAIGTAVRQALAAHRGQPVAGVLLITDGQSNAGEPPIKAAQDAGADGVPVVVLAAGTPEGPRNAKLTKLEVSPVVFVRDPSRVGAVIESRGLAGAPASVVLERSRDGGPWEEVARQDVTLEEAGRVQAVNFELKEDRPAKLQLRARLEDVGPELTADDNVASEEVRVIRQKIRVLFVAGSTFPEVEFVRNALLRDAGVSASTWLQTADARYEHPGNPPIKRLPRTREELNEFDCVVLYDPDPALWPQDYGELLADFVAKAGGGLVYVAGERMTKALFDRQEEAAQAWLSLLPVVVEPGLYQSDVQMKLSARTPWKLEITPEGRVDPVFQFAPTAEKNDPILAALPGVYWHFPVTRAKSGATVLARHADPRMRNEHGNHVVLATQLVGPGRTFFVAFDSTYRWRYLSEQYFDGFWARVIDRAGRSKQLGGRYPFSLAMDRATYRPGTQATLTARFENAADVDPALEAMQAEVQVADAEPLRLTLAARPGEAGVFEAAFPVERPGPHFVRVWPGDDAARAAAKPATLQFPVELPNVEYERPTQDPSTLRQVAAASGGAVFDLADATRAADAFRVGKVARTLEDRQEVWNAPLVFGCVLLAIFMEWVLRKKYRMV